MNTRKLSYFLSKWCKNNGFNVRIRYGVDFAYYYNKDIIRYAFLVPTDSEMWFKEVFENEGLKYDCDIFLLSFFHELGHYKTEDVWTEKESSHFNELKDQLNGELRDDNFAYFYTPDEIMATRWAVDYINNNFEKIQYFWKNVQKLIFEIYEQMGWSIDE